MADLKAEALRYWQMGFNVVALFYEYDGEGKVSNKRAFVEWGRWHSQRQTEEEFNSQPWDRADGFGVVCSFPNKDGLFLTVIDYDVKKVTEEAKAKGKALLSKFPITQMEQTVSGGIHLVYLSRVKPSRSIGEFHDSHALELIGTGKLCVMAPSKGYKRLNDNEPTVIEDVEGLFFQVLGVEDARARKNEGLSNDLLQKWLEQLKAHLEIKGEGSQYYYILCPFHKEKHPSFAIHKSKFYAVDYHDNKVYSLKELAEALGVQLEGAKTGEGEEEEEEINLYRLAQEILAETPIVTDMRTYLMYRWNGKCWVDDAEGFIHRKLVEVEGESFKPYHLTTLTQIIQGLTFVNCLEEPPPNLICFENGVLDLNTMQLKPHSPEYFFRNTIHAEYNSDAKAERFLKWLEEVLPDEEARFCVQEMFGYSLYRDYSFHYIFFLVGSGRNGKGTLMRTLIDLVGRENCTSIPLERLPERFQTTNLIGKLANIVSEPKTSLVTTETIKQLTGQDLITAEFKGKQKTFQFINYAKLIVVANRLPPVSDSSLAWWERVIVIEFPVTITPEKMVPNIEERWLNSPEERSGIVNWALEGLKRLLENKRFTRNEAMLNVVEQYKRWSQPAQYFLEKYCEYGANLWVTKKALYEAFKIVCEEEGLPVLSEQQFSAEVRKKPRVMLMQKRVEGKVERVWVGLDLKEVEGVKQLKQLKQPVVSFVKCEEGEDDKEESENFKEYMEVASPASVASVGGSTAVLTCENVERVWNALVEASRVRGSAHISEVAALTGLPREAVEAILRRLEREGRAFSPYPDWWKPVL
ncbi:MAG: phage/plasmid primase, P4 family [Candidatus Bathyarchaeia archaeon]